MSPSPTRWHPHVLPAPGNQVVSWLTAEPWFQEFYLAGGTGLALQIGHRLSEDLDCFTEGSLLKTASRRRLIGKLRRAPDMQLVEQDEGTLHLTMAGLKVSLLHFPYPLLKPAKHWRNLALADVVDIGLMKMGAIVGRGSKKDFLDLYLITKDICPLLPLCRLAKKKFPDSKDFIVQACRALAYFDDAEPDPMPHLLGPKVTWTTIKSYFEREVRALTRSLLVK